MMNETLPRRNSGEGSILLVDDDDALRQVLHVTLSGLGFSVAEASRGHEALSFVQNSPFDAVLLDVDLPGMDGVETCRSMRRVSPQLQILMLTGMDGEDDKVVALEAGADDYITKPFQLRELTARLRAAVRRRSVHSVSQEAVIVHGDIELDPVRFRVRKQGRSIHLTPKEFEILHYLMANAGESISRDRLLKTGWDEDRGKEFVYLRIIVAKLRRKIEDKPFDPRYLVTVPNFGYRFNTAEAAL